MTQTKTPIKTYTMAQWLALGAQLFGPDMNLWQFVCPSCGHVASAPDWKAVGMTPGQVAFSCVGSGMKKAADAFGGKGSGPCNYAGGGLIRIGRVCIVELPDTYFFDFAGLPDLWDRLRPGSQISPTAEVWKQTKLEGNRPVWAAAPFVQGQSFIIFESQGMTISVCREDTSDYELVKL